MLVIVESPYELQPLLKLPLLLDWLDMEMIEPVVGAGEGILLTLYCGPLDNDDDDDDGPTRSLLVRDKSILSVLSLLDEVGDGVRERDEADEDLRAALISDSNPLGIEEYCCLFLLLFILELRMNGIFAANGLRLQLLLLLPSVLLSRSKIRRPALTKSTRFGSLLLDSKFDSPNRWR